MIVRTVRSFAVKVLMLGALAAPCTLVSPGRADAQSGRPTVSSLPRPVGVCPQLNEGMVRLLDTEVRIVVSGDGQRRGPLIIYWQGTDSDAARELTNAFGEPVQRELRAVGGLLAAPVATTGIGRTTTGNGVWFEGDMKLADEIVACALEQNRIDSGRIHSMGMSAGGLQTAAFGYARSNYVASVVTYSGGHLTMADLDGTNTTFADPSNKFAALIFHGGPQDQYGLHFDHASRRYAEFLAHNGHFAVICNHGEGHAIPAGIGAAAWRFISDHPYGQARAYEGVLPDAIAAFCRP